MRFGYSIAAVLAVLITVVSPAHADLVVRFEEGAPKDRFVVTNETGCTFGRGVLVLDLRRARSGLLFDTVQAGFGVNSAQPLEVARADNVIVDAEPIPDGALTGKLAFRNFASDGELEITIDVDDRNQSDPSEFQMIDPSELSGARVRVVLQDSKLRMGEFDETGIARVTSPNCSDR